MKKVNFKYSALWLLLLALVTSCVFDEADPLVENTAPQDPVMVTFKLDVMSSAATKADNLDWNDEYATHSGNDFESRINTSDLLVLAYKTDGTFAAELPIIMRGTNNDGKVGFMCKLPDELVSGNPVSMKFMVLANCLNSGYRLSYNGLVPNVEGLMYSIPTQIASWAAIPMWGVKTHSFAYTNGSMNGNQDLGTIDVLRSTAKVGVKLSAELAKKYKLGGLMINRVAASGYSVPNDWNRTVQTDYLIHDNCFRQVQVQGEYPTVADVAKFIAATDGTQYTYVPETANSGDNELAIALTLTDKATSEVHTFDYTKGLKFRPYNTDGAPTGAPYNIVRNHYYEYMINDIVLGDLFLTLRVADWDDAPVWDVDFEAPLHTNLMTSPSKNADAPQGVPQVYYDNSDPTGLTGAFVGYFSMDSPKGVTWKPTLANVSAGDYEVRVYTNIDQNGNVRDSYDILVTDANIEAKIGRFYKIVVVAKNPNNVGTVVKLGLSYAPLWNHEANPLLVVNKKGDGLYYPWNQQTGDTSSDKPDISWISIRQVTKP